MSRIAAFRFMCDCLSKRPYDELERTVASKDFLWATLMEVALEHRIAPIMGTLGILDLLPQHLASFFSGSAAYCRQQNSLARVQAIEVAGALNQLGVTPLFMKGGAHLLSRLYLDPAQRPMADLDILVPAERIDDCAASLKTIGFLPTTSYLHPRAHHSQPLARPDSPLPIELHHNVLAYPNWDFLTTDELRSSSLELDIDGARIAVPSPTSAAIHNIAHAQLNDHDYLYGRMDLRGLLHLAQLSRTYGDALNWGLVCPRFRRKRHLTALGYHLLCATELAGFQTPEGTPIRPLSRLLFRRALSLAGHPKSMSLTFKLMRPIILLRREMCDPSLRHRLARNLILLRHSTLSSCGVA